MHLVMSVIMYVLESSCVGVALLVISKDKGVNEYLISFFLLSS